MAQKYIMQGVLKRISDIKQITPRFQTRNFILDSGTKENYNPVKFQLSGKYIDYVDDRMIGRKVEIDFYIDGHATAKGYFNNLCAVSVMYVES